MMKKLILDLDNKRVLTGFYHESEDVITVKDIQIIENKDITEHDSIITGKSLDEVKTKLIEEFTKREECCSICGKTFVEGQRIYKTDKGVVACDLSELLTTLKTNNG